MSTSTTCRPSRITSSTGKNIQEPTSSKKMERSPNWIYSLKNRGFRMPGISGTIMKTKLFIGISKQETTCSSTGSPPSIKLDSWLTESKYYPKKALLGWTMLTARATTLISMETRWTCMHFRLSRRRQKLSFASATKCTKIQQTVNLCAK